MSPEDIWVMDSVRRDVDKDIVVMLEDGDNGVNMIEWWDVSGFDSDLFFSLKYFIPLFYFTA